MGTGSWELGAESWGLVSVSVGLSVINHRGSQRINREPQSVCCQVC